MKIVKYHFNVLLGGYFHGRGDLSYGVDVLKLRWLGVLQVVIVVDLQLFLVLLLFID